MVVGEGRQRAVSERYGSFERFQSDGTCPRFQTPASESCFSVLPLAHLRRKGRDTVVWGNKGRSGTREVRKWEVLTESPFRGFSTYGDSLFTGVGDTEVSSDI